MVIVSEKTLVIGISASKQYCGKWLNGYNRMVFKTKLLFLNKNRNTFGLAAYGIKTNLRINDFTNIILLVCSVEDLS